MEAHLMLKRFTFYLECLAFIFVVFQTVYAQERMESFDATAVPTNPDNFKESTDPLPNVSGSPLVGLRIGDISGEKIDPERIFIVLPENSSKGICISSKTKDGRFSSENHYSINLKNRNARIAIVDPFTKNNQSYLEKYLFGDLAVHAYQPDTNECIPKKAIHLPQIAQLPTDCDSLFLMLNSNGRPTKAVLAVEEDTKINQMVAKTEASCKSASGGASLAFDTICRFFNLNFEKATKCKLEVNFNDGFGDEKHVFMVLLPETRSLK
jgi:hypothetical protein